MEDLEKKALNNLNFIPPFYYRYVDDIITAIPKNSIDTVLRTFNSVHPCIQFSYETMNNNNISFLDLSLNLIDCAIRIDWYHKPTF